MRSYEEFVSLCIVCWWVWYFILVPSGFKEPICWNLIAYFYNCLRSSSGSQSSHQNLLFIGGPLKVLLELQLKFWFSHWLMYSVALVPHIISQLFKFFPQLETSLEQPLLLLPGLLQISLYMWHTPFNFIWGMCVWEKINYNQYQILAAISISKFIDDFASPSRSQVM